ncbi:hypothetical protein GCM10009764_68840 [Nocardia ninae]|uniref:Uncharacterized protein n=1 Tax=Nocardia ninae NBRC 108245 TaxID=1210091 RepID=A0A511MB71_9NOCA|nr:hypothetical protein NN4_24320 [Nocardia ninae NBRC 108245]
MPALAAFDEQPAREETIEVFGRGGRGHSGVTGELTCGPGAAVDQGETHVGAGAVGEQRGETCQFGSSG